MSTSGMSPTKRLAGAYTANADALRRQQLARRAAGHSHDPEMERVLELKADSPDAYARLALGLRLAAAHYADSKQAEADRASP